MFLDQDSLRPVIIAMSVYIAISVLVPKLIKKPTGIQFIDDIVMSIISQKDSLMSGTIVIGIVVLVSNYIQEELL
jgi:hypothetical protein